MNNYFKRIVLDAAPPIVVRTARIVRGGRKRLNNVLEWEADTGGVARWNGDGWSHPSIVEMQRSRWKAFLESTRAPHQFGIWPGGKDVDTGLHNLIMTFGYVLGLAANGHDRLTLLDWGGGLGHYYVYAQQLHPNLALDYTVKDLPVFCAAGQSLLSDVHFVSDDNSALRRCYDLVFASSSVHYATQVYDTVRQLAQSAKAWLFITRLPCVEDADDFVVIQRPVSHGYMTEYPCWFVNREKFIRFTEACGFVLRREFAQSEAPFVHNAPEQCRYTGFLFQRRADG